jgi:ubiquitin carboxyl-terminal hydrolase 9/13
VPGSPQAQGKPEETKDSPEYKKRMALQAGPVLDMIHDNSNKYGMDESLFTALKDIFDAIRENDSRLGVVSPHKFLEILRRDNEMFRSAMHQDAHEFLNLLLNSVVDNVESFSKQHPTLNSTHANGGPPETSPVVETSKALTKTPSPTNGSTDWVHDLFEGLLTSETRCLTCENTSRRDEPFMDLSVDLGAHTSVTSCLRKFSEEEMLCERNKFHCDNCGGLQEAEKRMKIKRLPRVLALHLKRFKYTEDLQRLQKLFHRVVYPFHLRLFNTTEDAEDPDRLYELYAVVVHIGGGPYHGHYVSIIKTQDRGWLLFDDELVEPVDKSYVLNFFGGEPIPGLQDAKQLACAYVLFYQETTLEAVLKEQEMEGQQPTVPAKVSEDTAKDGLSPVKSTPILPQDSTPIMEDTEHMQSLAHAVTAPDIVATVPTPVEPVQTLPASPLKPTKSRKEKKAEEKAAKAAAKAEQKELEEKRRQASQRRVEAWKRQDDELKRAIEESKQSAADEAEKRGDKPPPIKEGGLSRFRHSSMSLRGKPKLFGAKDKDGERDRLASVPQESSKENDGNTNGLGGTTANTPGLERVKTEGEVKKSRFSLGRKKSQALS